MLRRPRRVNPDSLNATVQQSDAETGPVKQDINQSPPRLVTILDLLILAGIVVLTPIAWLLPQPLWSKLGRSAVSLVLLLMPWLPASRAANINLCLGAAPWPPARVILIRALSRYFEDILLLLKCYRPGGWEPVVEVRGLEHLQAAVAGGRGVVLWFSHFIHASLVSKIALHRAGYAMSHLSHPRHGFSPTRFGMRFLNPVRTRVEKRYLKERVCMELDSATAAVNILRERLLAGGIVSITARDIARKPVGVPFLAGTLSLATGAPALAQQTQATLLPIHVVQLESGVYAAIIDTPVILDAALPRWEAGESAAREYAQRLETVVRAFPDQWLGWGNLDTPAASSSIPK